MSDKAQQGAGRVKETHTHFLFKKKKAIKRTGNEKQLDSE